MFFFFLFFFFFLAGKQVIIEFKENDSKIETLFYRHIFSIGRYLNSEFYFNLNFIMSLNISLPPPPQPHLKNVIYILFFLSSAGFPFPIISIWHKGVR